MALIKHDYDLKSLTRVHVGGKASHFILANDIPAVKNAVQFSQNHSLPIYVLGAGTNILINDETFNGIVLKLGGDLNSIKIDENTRTISAGGATPLMKLGFTLAREGCVGYLYMAVIPGTVGGAVRMNAGTSDKGEIKDHFVKALVFDLKASKISEYNFADMQFGHRKSVIAKRNLIILQATFKLPRKE
ncbi:FAD-binding protein, partial [bacterium]|nr:FAD-binding protein [bacterium]